MKSAKPAKTRKPSKVRLVPIPQMRVPPALTTQRQFRKAHGDMLAVNLDLNKLGYPIMNHRDGVYWVLDGQHRIYAMRENGFENDAIECEVYEDLSDAEMADIFLGRDVRRAISPFDKFHVACTAGHRRESDVRRVVEATGWKIGRGKQEGCIGATSALCKVYDRSGDEVLGQVCRTIKSAYGGDPRAADKAVIEGLGLVFNRYNGKTDEKELAGSLSDTPHGVRGLIRRADSLRERTGNQKSQCVAAAIVDIYNRGLAPRAVKRLPSWWKEAR